MYSKGTHDVVKDGGQISLLGQSWGVDRPVNFIELRDGRKGPDEFCKRMMIAGCGLSPASIRGKRWILQGDREERKV